MVSAIQFLSTYACVHPLRHMHIQLATCTHIYMHVWTEAINMCVYKLEHLGACVVYI